MSGNSIQNPFKQARVLITGATGLTGKLLTQKLAKAGAKISAIARPSSNIQELHDLGVKLFRGDVFDPQIVGAATDNVEYIFHLAAAFREEKATDRDYQPVHVHSTQLLARAVLNRPDFKRFVHISTVGVHGHIEIESANETYRFSPGDGYQRTKLEAELWLREFASENRIPFTIIRPTPIFGPGDNRLLKFFRMINRGYLLMLGLGRKGIYHLIHVDDLTEILMLAATSDAALSQVFIAANDDPISIEDMGMIIAKALDKNIRTIRLPVAPFFLAADVCKAVCAPLGIQPPIYRRRVAFYTKDRKFDNSKLRNTLGYRLRYDNRTGLTQTAQWYLARGWL